jgi:hypothetical protein
MPPTSRRRLIVSAVPSAERSSEPNRGRPPNRREMEDCLRRAKAQLMALTVREEGGLTPLAVFDDLATLSLERHD